MTKQALSIFAACIATFSSIDMPIARATQQCSTAVPLPRRATDDPVKWGRSPLSHLRQTAAGQPGSDCREQAAGPDPGLHRRAAKEARHVPLGQGAAATWPEESYVQGRIDGTPGRRVARSGSFTRRPLEKQISTPTHRKAAILLPSSDISNWRKS